MCDSGVRLDVWREHRSVTVRGASLIDNYGAWKTIYNLVQWNRPTSNWRRFPRQNG